MSRSLPGPGRTLRAIGFDDAPFTRGRGGARVHVAGVVCAGTRFEGLVLGAVRQDGWNARAGRRLELLRRAGPIHAHGAFTFQVRGGDPREIGPALHRLTDRGHVPEALRLAHLVGAAVVRGESGRRA